MRKAGLQPSGRTKYTISFVVEVRFDGSFSAKAAAQRKKRPNKKRLEKPWLNWAFKKNDDAGSKSRLQPSGCQGSGAGCWAQVHGR